MGARISRSRWLAFASVVAALTITTAGSDQAQARAKSKRDHARPRAIHGPNYRPPYAAIVIDDKSGVVLHEASADEPRHPASLTKIMTLYLLFEQLEAGKLKLETPLPVTRKASLQNPTKLGLKSDQTIKVEDAILGLVTKSANDAAVVVAESVAGSEEEFAARMTLKARALGMSGTTYVNASGLPAEAQITTARDQALLGRAIQHRFPVYYRYFATPSFRYKGAEMRNHNNLLGNVKGVDGIKTGYTDASGYNLTSSVRRDEKHIVAVVLGGKSNGARDARMRQLIEEHIVRAAAMRTAPIVAEVDDPAQPESPRVVAVAPAAPKTAIPMGDTDGTAAAAVEAKIDAVPIPRPRVLAAKSAANPPTLTASTKAAPARAPRAIAKASTPSPPASAYTLSSTPVERRAGPSSY
jgi:D-alanyl-D-alanine carboxypeptidase